MLHAADKPQTTARCDGCGRPLGIGTHRVIVGVGSFHERCSPPPMTAARLLALKQEVAILREGLLRPSERPSR